MATKLTYIYYKQDNAKCGISPHLEIRPCDLENQ